MEINELIESASRNRVRVVGIVATDLKWGIGIDDKLPEFPYLDLQWFKHNTKNKICIVGSTTFATLPSLVDRSFFVITRNPSNWVKNRQIGPNVDNHRVVGIGNNIEVAIRDAKKMAFAKGQTEIMVIGGSEIYNHCIENGLLDDVLVTRVAKDYACNIKINNDALYMNYRSKPLGFTTVDDIKLSFFIYHRS